MIVFTFPFLLLPLVVARILQFPVDTYAFPKHSVAFLNALPVPNDLAHRWLRDGLRGGEREFLDQPWRVDDQVAMGIGSGDFNSSPDPPRHTLEHMKLTPQLSYLCLIPPAVDHTPPSTEDEPDSQLAPIRGWSLLQPLTDTCLYHRQGWFTYSYCHNKQIRQFKELPHSHPHPPGGYKPEEDPDSVGYTLGRAPAALDPGADLTVAEQSAVAANLELAREAGARYLVQRWSDGTFCEKAGKNREVEVQFHCSMTTTDTILFVKEAKTCSYVLVIHTPRLCGVPGFRSPLDSREEAIVRCRQIVDSSTHHAPADHGPVAAEADQPHQLPRRKPVLSETALRKEAEKQATTGESGYPQTTEDAINAMIQRAIKALMVGRPPDEGGFQLDDRLAHEGVVLIDNGNDDDLDGAFVEIDGPNGILDVLRAAGFGIKGERQDPGHDEGTSPDEDEGEDQIRRDV